jgi:6-phosphogluconolactonase
MAEPRIVIADDPDDLAERAAGHVVMAVEAALGRRGRADIALSGGSTPVALYRLLAQPEWRGRVAWDRVHLWFGDERYVPPDHPDSNLLLVESILLGTSAYSSQTRDGARGISGPLGLNVPASHIHPLPIQEAIAQGGGPAWAAERYAAELSAELPQAANGAPALDLILVGVGPDGHILSIFPGSPTLLGTGPIVAAVPAPQHIGPHHPRLTLAPRLLTAAADVLVLVAGAAKAPVISTVFGPPPDPSACPAVLLRREGVTWLLDRSAAAGLPATLAVER